MGVAELVTIFKTTFGRLRGSPGSTVNASATGIGGAGIEAEYMQAGGVMHRPGKNTRAVFIPLSSGRRYGIMIGEQNYGISIEVGEGETAIYSTTADGKTVKAKILLDSSGKIKVSNAEKDLKSILDTLIGHISGLTTINCVQGSPVTLAPSVIAQLEQDKAALAQLLK